jgi:hypothetical protein
MTAVVKHTARNKPRTAGTATPAQPRNSQLRQRFPARPARSWWPETAQGQEETRRRLTSPPFLPVVKATQAGRRRGTARLLRWLSSFPGDTWQQRWEASGAEEHPGSSWLPLPLGWLRDNGLAASYDENDLSSGLLMLICGDVIRPRMAWMVTRAHRHLAPVMAEVRDPAGFARLRELADAGPAAARKDARLAATRIATILACKGGVISDIAVGDCVEMADTQRLVHSRGGQKKVDFYLRLHALGIFPADAPATIRAFGMAQGQLTVEELVDRYRLQCNPRQLGEALRACARGIHPLEAGTGLLIDCGNWLHREDFTSRFVIVETDTGDDGTPLAATDWEAAIAALHDGELSASGGERRMLLLAASIAGGIPVSLYDALPGIDRRNASRVVGAVAHAAGLPNLETDKR